MEIQVLDDSTDETAEHARKKLVNIRTWDLTSTISIERIGVVLKQVL